MPNNVECANCCDPVDAEEARTCPDCGAPLCDFCAQFNGGACDECYTVEKVITEHVMRTARHA